MTDPPSERTPDAAPALEGAPDAEPEQPALRLLPPAQAAAELSAAGEAARGFLGLDPVTQNAALLGRELAHRDAVVLRYGETLLGCAVNPEQPRQAEVAVTAADAPALGALLEFLRTYQRCSSFVSLVPDGRDTSAFEAHGFRTVGTLRGHRFAQGRYHDVRVLAWTA
ncbi:hypothetical protein MTQ10_22660 [Streptomyces sp. XM83C]|uniref:hypothetical protein n=1 Tax=unclassified Streptomyces TaxID=2593676 RepID=UPI001FFBB79B|nr:hypothetical protein [Streptomyces sp. XM83C]MCK1822333.1 hypothetical protein [Streptomyces sp. XM83C]